jgi:hypothetical protein
LAKNNTLANVTAIVRNLSHLAGISPAIRKSQTPKEDSEIDRGLPALCSKLKARRYGNRGRARQKKSMLTGRSTSAVSSSKNREEDAEEDVQHVLPQTAQSPGHEFIRPCVEKNSEILDSRSKTDGATHDDDNCSANSNRHVRNSLKPHLNQIAVEISPLQEVSERNTGMRSAGTHEQESLFVVDFGASLEIPPFPMESDSPALSDNARENVQMMEESAKAIGDYSRLPKRKQFTDDSKLSASKTVETKTRLTMQLQPSKKACVSSEDGVRTGGTGSHNGSAFQRSRQGDPGHQLPSPRSLEETFSRQANRTRPESSEGATAAHQGISAGTDPLRMPQSVGLSPSRALPPLLDPSRSPGNCGTQTRSQVSGRSRFTVDVLPPG